MTAHLSTTARALEALLESKGGGTIVEFVLSREDAGISYRDTAHALADATGIYVSHESVRGWAKNWRHQTGRPLPDPTPTESAA